MTNINDYKGLNILNVLESDARKGVYQANWDHIFRNYGDNVEWQKLRNQIYLCDATRNYIYSKPGKVKYEKGTRPVIEAVVEYVTRNAETEREKVLALLTFGRDLYLGKKEEQFPFNFYGGTEERLIEKGENLCECMGRLMVSLCEVLGIPGRIVMHVVCGHINCEVFIEDKWCFFDPRFAVFFVDENEKFLSVEEIMQNKDVIFNQPDWVKKYVSQQVTFDKISKDYYNLYMHPNQIHTFCDYSLMDYNLYTYNIVMENIPEKTGIREAQARYGYYNKLVMEENRQEWNK
ncbi:MAG: transglutaminase domain-containing protein [Clostridia bacterium]|nr:transglutaminase domain-containing protein [Clostridia bacterium]